MIKFARLVRSLLYLPLWKQFIEAVKHVYSTVPTELSKVASGSATPWDGGRGGQGIGSLTDPSYRTQNGGYSQEKKHVFELLGTEDKFVPPENCCEMSNLSKYSQKRDKIFGTTIE